MNNILIAHRGNISGPNPDYENNPDYIKDAVRLGFNAEVDVWKVGDQFLTGHDYPQYPIDKNFLSIYGLWAHAKNIAAFSDLVNNHRFTNSFYHTNEDVVLTTEGYLWTNPGQPTFKNSICVLPEKQNWYIGESAIGICSDYIERFKV